MKNHSNLMYKKSSQQNGFILIIGIVVMAILFTVSTSLWGYTSMQIKSSRQAVTQSQAMQIAEAGIDKAIYELNQDSSFNGEAGVDVAGGEFTTSVSTIDSSNKQISSTGYVPDSTNPTDQITIKVKVSIDLDNIAFNFGVQVGAGGLTMGNNSSIIGNVYSNGNISGSGDISGDATVAGGGSPTLDQQCTTNSANFDFNTSAKSDVVQKFTPTVSGPLSRVSLYIKKTGSPSNATVRILSNSGSNPTKTQVGGNGTISSSNVTTSYGWLDVSFASNPSLNSGTNYWILIDSSGNASNYYSWATDSNDSCSNGTAKYSSNWNASSPTYTAISKDMNFKTYMGGVATSLSGVHVTGNARANTLTSCTIGVGAYYATTNTCSGGVSHSGTPDSPQQSMPISQAQIDEWKDVAVSGGVYSGNYTVSGTQTFGPRKIVGNLTVTNGAKLYMTGPLWVTGNITVSNNGWLKVDNSLGGTGTVALADGNIDVSNNGVASGNTYAGSYALMISTNTGGSAISLGNNSAGAIYYAANGTVQVSNNAGAYQVTGYAISLSNNSTITYQSGLADASFSNGPGGSWAKVDGSYIIIDN